MSNNQINKIQIQDNIVKKITSNDGSVIINPTTGVGEVDLHASGGGSGGRVDTVTPEIDKGIEVDSTDPINPKVGVKLDPASSNILSLSANGLFGGGGIGTDNIVNILDDDDLPTEYAPTNILYVTIDHNKVWKNTTKSLPNNWVQLNSFEFDKVVMVLLNEGKFELRLLGNTSNKYSVDYVSEMGSGTVTGTYNSTDNTTTYTQTLSELIDSYSITIRDFILVEGVYYKSYVFEGYEYNLLIDNYSLNWIENEGIEELAVKINTDPDNVLTKTPTGLKSTGSINSQIAITNEDLHDIVVDDQVLSIQFSDDDPTDMLGRIAFNEIDGTGYFQVDFNSTQGVIWIKYYADPGPLKNINILENNVWITNDIVTPIFTYYHLFHKLAIKGLFECTSISSQLSEDTGSYEKINYGNVGNQVQSDWNESDNTQPDYIKNKPVIIPEASNDGIQYGRQNNSWTPITGVENIVNISTDNDLPVNEHAPIDVLYITNDNNKIWQNREKNLPNVWHQLNAGGSGIDNIVIITTDADLPSTANSDLLYITSYDHKIWQYINSQWVQLNSGGGSGIDNIVVIATDANLPSTANSDLLYITTDNHKVWQYIGSQWVKLNAEGNDFDKIINFVYDDTGAIARLKGPTVNKYYLCIVDNNDLVLYNDIGSYNTDLETLYVIQPTQKILTKAVITSEVTVIGSPINNSLILKSVNFTDTLNIVKDLHDVITGETISNMILPLYDVLPLYPTGNQFLRSLDDETSATKNGWVINIISDGFDQRIHIYEFNNGVQTLDNIIYDSTTGYGNNPCGGNYYSYDNQTHVIRFAGDIPVSSIFSPPVAVNTAKYTIEKGEGGTGIDNIITIATDADLPATANNDLLYITTDNHKIWQYIGGQWVQLNAGSTGIDNVVVIANDAALPSTANSDLLYITSDNHKIWQYIGTAWVQLNSGSGTSYDTDQFLALYDPTSDIGARKVGDKLKLSTRESIFKDLYEISLGDITDEFVFTNDSFNLNGASINLKYNLDDINLDIIQSNLPKKDLNELVQGDPVYKIEFNPDVRPDGLKNNDLTVVRIANSEDATDFYDLGIFGATDTPLGDETFIAIYKGPWGENPFDQVVLYINNNVQDHVWADASPAWAPEIIYEDYTLFFNHRYEVVSMTITQGSGFPSKLADVTVDLDEAINITTPLGVTNLYVKNDTNPNGLWNPSIPSNVYFSWDILSHSVFFTSNIRCNKIVDPIQYGLGQYLNILGPESNKSLIEEAPMDGQAYVRRMGEWIPISIPSLSKDLHDVKLGELVKRIQFTMEDILPDYIGSDTFLTSYDDKNAMDRNGWGLKIHNYNDHIEYRIFDEVDGIKSNDKKIYDSNGWSTESFNSDYYSYDKDTHLLIFNGDYTVSQILDPPLTKKIANYEE
jgi:hypothetical protein